MNVYKDYAAEREANIQRNNELLISLGLDQNVFTGAPTATTLATAQSKPKAKKSAPRKRVEEEADYQDAKNVDTESSEDEKPRPKKVKPARVSLGTRRSMRNDGRPLVDYADDNSMRRAVSMPKLVSASLKKRKRKSHSANEGDIDMDDGSGEDDEDRPRHKLGKRTKNPRTFGHIPGVPVGKTWELRMHCSTDAVHAPPVAGISGNKDTGAYSIALSGGYEDDVDLGYAFTFTGAGGRDLKGTRDKPKNLRTAPQSIDQDFDHTLNAALQKSAETKKPVRVIRGYKLDSKFAPKEGYRYDGLYVVERAWMDVGLNKGHFKVCKFALKRLPDQPLLPERGLDDDEDDEEDEENASERDPTTEGDDETQETAVSSADEAMPDAKDE